MYNNIPEMYNKGANKSKPRLLKTADIRRNTNFSIELLSFEHVELLLLLRPKRLYPCIWITIEIQGAGTTTHTRSQFQLQKHCDFENLGTQLRLNYIMRLDTLNLSARECSRACGCVGREGNGEN
ncbi:hypothetical protein SESBI_38471 [Sesbania bispinosa]|nr:hypothetical protein SESBI_38471 [Sesbania bispinosa]